MEEKKGRGTEVITSNKSPIKRRGIKFLRAFSFFFFKTRQLMV